MRSRLLAILLALCGLVAVYVLPRGIPLLGYEPERSDNYLWGAFHVHSTLSDGLLPLEAVASEAREARVTVVLLSEHGAPHPEATVLDETLEGVRFIGGSEVGLPEGHLIVSGAREVPRYKLPPFPPDAVADINEWGGLAIVTYPEDPEVPWTYWEDDLRPDGLEIVNVTSSLRASSWFQKLDWAVFSWFSPHYFVSGLEPPHYALERWDEMLARGPVFGLYAANAHGGVVLPDGNTLEFPSYATAFQYAGLGIDPRFANAPEAAIRRGEFFSIVRSAGEPQRFELGLEGDAVRVRVETLSLATKIDLRENGVVVASSRGGEIRYGVHAPAVYRAEVYLENHLFFRPDVPWILSNPMYVDVAYPEWAAPELDCAGVETLPLERFAIEKDEASEATLEHRFGSLDWRYELSQATPEKIDRWVALAYREPVDLTGTKGVRLLASSSETMRYWVELRSGELSHYASFKVRTGEPQFIGIPWEHFYRMLGGREPPPLGEIDAVFVTVNTSNSRTGFASELVLNELGWCR